MYFLSPRSPSLRIFCGVSATGNNLAVALFTPASVACAERITDTSNSNGVRYSSSVVGSGSSSRKRRNNSMTSKRFIYFPLRSKKEERRSAWIPANNNASNASTPAGVFAIQNTRPKPSRAIPTISSAAERADASSRLCVKLRLSSELPAGQHTSTDSPATSAHHGAIVVFQSGHHADSASCSSTTTVPATSTVNGESSDALTNLRDIFKAIEVATAHTSKPIANTSASPQPRATASSGQRESQGTIERVVIMIDSTARTILYDSRHKTATRLPPLRPRRAA